MPCKPCSTPGSDLVYPTYCMTLKGKDKSFLRKSLDSRFRIYHHCMANPIRPAPPLLADYPPLLPNYPPAHMLWAVHPVDTRCREARRGGIHQDAIVGPCPLANVREPTKPCLGNAPSLKPTPNCRGRVCYADTSATNTSLVAGSGANPVNNLSALVRQIHTPTCNICRRRELHNYPDGRDTCICAQRVLGWKCHACLHDAYDQTTQLAYDYRTALRYVRRTNRGGNQNRGGLVITDSTDPRQLRPRCRCGRSRGAQDLNRRNEVLFCFGCRGTISSGSVDGNDIGAPLPENPDDWPCLDKLNNHEAV